MGAIRGSDFILSIEVNGEQVPVCYATDCQISRTFDTREISGPQGRDRDYISDYRGYEISIPILIVYDQIYNYTDFSKAAESGLKIKWFASAFENGGIVYSGEALITQLDLTSQMRDVMKSDVSLIGCGEFKTDYLPINKQVYLSGFDKIQLAGCPNPYPVAVYWYDQSLIGPADNVDEVIQIFNDYSAANGGLYTLTSSVDGGCLFNMEIAFDAPQPYPDVVFAQQGALFAISTDQSINDILSTDQDDNNALTPIG